MAYAPDARPLGDLFSDLMRDITTLVRSEMALARAEMGAKLSRVQRHVGGIVAGGVIALVGLFTLEAFLVLGTGARWNAGVGFGARRRGRDDRHRISRRHACADRSAAGEPGAY